MQSLSQSYSCDVEEQKLFYSGEGSLQAQVLATMSQTIPITRGQSFPPKMEKCPSHLGFSMTSFSLTVTFSPSQGPGSTAYHALCIQSFCTFYIPCLELSSIVLCWPQIHTQLSPHWRHLTQHLVGDLLHTYTQGCFLGSSVHS